MSGAKPVRVLPADVYDTLEFAALAFDGIGARTFTEDMRTEGAPLCAWGLAHFAEPGENGRYGLYTFEADGEVTRALADAGIRTEDNDDAVEKINRRRGAMHESRVPFDAWARELNVVRGDI